MNFSVEFLGFTHTTLYIKMYIRSCVYCILFTILKLISGIWFFQKCKFRFYIEILIPDILRYSVLELIRIFLWNRVSSKFEFRLYGHIWIVSVLYKPFWHINENWLLCNKFQFKLVVCILITTGLVNGSLTCFYFFTFKYLIMRHWILQNVFNPRKIGMANNLSQL